MRWNNLRYSSEILELNFEERRDRKNTNQDISEDGMPLCNLIKSPRVWKHSISVVEKWQNNDKQLEFMDAASWYD